MTLNRSGRINVPLEKNGRDCIHRGPDLAGPEVQSWHDKPGHSHVTHSRRFALCMRPKFEWEGLPVCRCNVKGQQQCGTSCSGYVAEAV